jgi:hypothetical protein
MYLFDDRPIQGFSSVGVPHSCRNLMEKKVTLALKNKTCLIEILKKY